MTVNFVMTILLFVYIIGFILFFKMKDTKVRWVIPVILLILFFANPVRFKQENVSSLERGKNKFDKVPERVVVYKKSFEEKQREEMNTLKRESEESKNNEIDK